MSADPQYPIPDPLTPLTPLTFSPPHPSPSVPPLLLGPYGRDYTPPAHAPFSKRELVECAAWVILLGVGLTIGNLDSPSFFWAVVLSILVRLIF